MKDSNIICQLFDIDFPIIQGGMIWVSGGKLAAACSNAGILGLIGAGSMSVDILRAHILKAQLLIDKNKDKYNDKNSIPEIPRVGVNIPLLYSQAKEQIEVALSLGIKIFFTSAGSPKTYTTYLKDRGAKVVHVTSTPELAIKCQDAGVDAVVAEGFEAGGHNGRDEITTMVLIPQVVKAVKIPVIAAGGIVNGDSIAAAFCLGAKGVQMGSRFIATKESSAHQNFKDMILNSKSDSTMLALKKLVPVRLLKNSFYNKVKELEDRCADKEELEKLLGKGRAKLGMLDGNVNEGELEVGQGCALIDDLPSVKELVQQLKEDYTKTLRCEYP
ncbi:MAG: nitronate monooxygenase [Oligoflexia bacterium]|nr:nitronate monooxygenase [Oligoflexia bacterium]